MSIEATKAELLPCPFCNGERIEPFLSHNRFDPDMTLYFCKTCGAHSPDPKKGAARWNTRPREVTPAPTLSHEDLCRLSRVYIAHGDVRPSNWQSGRIHEWLKTQIEAAYHAEQARKCHAGERCGHLHSDHSGRCPEPRSTEEA